jgi:hypothetical protein
LTQRNRPLFLFVSPRPPDRITVLISLQTTRVQKLLFFNHKNIEFVCAVLPKNIKYEKKHKKLHGLLICRMLRRLGSFGGGRRVVVVARNRIDCSGMSIGRGG